MKTDKLEKFVLDHRPDFDDLEPSPLLWAGIEEGLEKPKIRSIGWKTVLWRAAAVVVIFTASYFVHDVVDNYKDDPLVAVEEDQPEYSEELQELLDAEAYYTSQVNNKKETLFILSKDQPMLVEEIDLELNELDSLYTELKNDLKDNADNEQVIEAMIQHYRIKLEILDEILYQIQRSNTSNSVENEKENIEI